MKVLLLGATGRLGKLMLSELLEANLRVNILVRDASKVEKHPNLQIIVGSPTSFEQLNGAAQGCFAILNVLNISRINDFPWASLRTPSDFLSITMGNIISTCKNNDIQRVIVCSAWGVSETKKDIPFWFRFLINRSNIGVAYKDHERQENLLINSNLKWTIVRPVGLTNFKKDEEVLESIENSPKPRLTISRSSVAKYMLECLTQNRALLQSPVISAK